MINWKKKLENKKREYFKLHKSNDVDNIENVIFNPEIAYYYLDIVMNIGKLDNLAYGDDEWILAKFIDIQDPTAAKCIYDMIMKGVDSLIIIKLIYLYFMKRQECAYCLSAMQTAYDNGVRDLSFFIEMNKMQIDRNKIRELVDKYVKSNSKDNDSVKNEDEITELKKQIKEMKEDIEDLKIEIEGISKFTEWNLADEKVYGWYKK